MRLFDRWYVYGYYLWVVLFFFQAEDGIRYLVRSRGLGDVYKRQQLLLQRFGLGIGLFLQPVGVLPRAQHRGIEPRLHLSLIHI